jgi:small conductance mechanosensitive channel
VWELVSGGIERYLAATGADGQTVERSARARTLLPLARNVLFIVLVVMVGLIVLAELGVNIAPLLAGAGVVGIAIGFGAQSLVKDVITGAFILFEDTIAVGDLVRLDAHAGTVEALSIRAIRLRDGTGALHTVPFSAVGTVVNMSRDFAYAVFEIGVSYDSDTDHVVAVMQDVGDDLAADAEYGSDMIEPLEVWGIERFEASAVVIKARCKTRPMKQWRISREYNRRLKKRFETEGIEIPLPQSTVWFGGKQSAAALPAPAN